jgi:hypothetical protein
MKKTIAAALVSTALILSTNALGQEAHKGEKTYYGGVLAEAKDTQYELVAKPDVITIFVHDHGKEISTKNATGKLTLLNGGEKTEVPLTPAGENKLEAKGSFKVDKGTKAVAVIALAGKPAQSVRFPLK